MATKTSKVTPVIKMPKAGTKDDIIRFEPFALRSGEVVGSIRVFYLDAQNERKPGKQGMTLHKREIPTFVKKLKELYEALPDEEEELAKPKPKKLKEIPAKVKPKTRVKSTEDNEDEEDEFPDE